MCITGTRTQGNIFAAGSHKDMYTSVQCMGIMHAKVGDNLAQIEGVVIF